MYALKRLNFESSVLQTRIEFGAVADLAAIFAFELFASAKTMRFRISLGGFGITPGNVLFLPNLLTEYKRLLPAACALEFPTLKLISICTHVIFYCTQLIDLIKL